MESTLHHQGSAAELCRARGWGPGTRLIGDEGYGPTVIEITGIGERSLLAKSLGHNGKAHAPRENSWVLWCRDWREAADDEIPVPIALGTIVASRQRPTVAGPVVAGPDGYGSYIIFGADGRRWRIPDAFDPNSQVSSSNVDIEAGALK